MSTIFRREFYSKLIIFGAVFLCFVFYLKFVDKRIEAVVNLSNNNLKTNLISDGLNDNQTEYFESLILADLTKQIPGLGDNGEAALMESEKKMIGKDAIKSLTLNEELSEYLSYNRTIPDIRNPLCQNITYDRDSLPTASVVIIFYNEPYSVLLRTLHSVLRTTDRRNLKEIILVDDASTNYDLKEKLDYYVSTRLPKDVVKILRLKDRSGIVGARLAGSRISTAEVLVFLDAHCEGTADWLEPLLKRIKDSPTSVSVPILDVIDRRDFNYHTVSKDHNDYIGGFTWNGKFNWIYPLKHEFARKRNECGKDIDICPTYTPTMVGGLFAISRDYFWKSGSYDDQMHGYGGENLEMSFRIWQCGGTIEIIPCSRFGHIPKMSHTSSTGGRDTEGINLARMALVWMDEYIDIFYMYRPDLKTNQEIGNVIDRRNLRSKLKCKSFDWYLKNVYPDKFIPTKNVKVYGRFAANSTNLCLDNSQVAPLYIGIFTCSRPAHTKAQFFSLTNSGVLRTELSCALVEIGKSKPYRVVMTPCLYSTKRCHKWTYSDSQIRHLDTNMCMDDGGLKIKDSIVVNDCDPNKISQKWIIEHI